MPLLQVGLKEDFYEKLIAIRKVHEQKDDKETIRFLINKEFELLMNTRREDIEKWITSTSARTG